jgi:starch-binding outer membrane protein, SusD/RagB family
MLNFNLYKMKIYKIKTYSLVLTALLTFSAISSCSDEFLENEQLSFLTPENALNSAAGMRAMLFKAHENIRAEYYGDGLPLITENIFSEVAIEGTTDKSGPAQDLNLLIVPDANLNSSNTNRIGWFWERWYQNIKFANTVISRIDDAEYRDDVEKNEILGIAYFHRSYAYYRLTQQFGDVPLLLREYTAPKLDFVSTARMTILTKIKADLDIAAGTVSANAAHGEIGKGAVNHLLTKVNLAMGNFDAAIASATAVINGGYSLVTARFGADKNDATKNVIWDLHRPANKINSEGILMGISRLGAEGSAGTTSAMRQAVPLWWRFITTPDGANGMSDNPGIEIDQVNKYGRGIGRNL